jgi:mannose-6-phosphate isomerase-like protein (cupin superfamily)
MRTIPIGLCGILTLWGVMASGQAEVRQQAPTDRALVFTLSDLQAEFRKLEAKKLSGNVRLLDGGDAFRVLLMHRIGAKTPETHGYLAEIYVIQEGSGTVVTGGTLVDAKKDGPDGREGDASGSSIRGGVEKTVKAGDVIFVPPGVPHGIVDGKPLTYMLIQFPWRK